GGSAAPDFIQQHETSSSRGVKNRTRFRHLHHESRLASYQVVAGSDPCEESIYHADRRTVRGNETANLRNEYDQPNLSEHGRFSRHVGSGENDHPCVFGEGDIVRNEFLARHLPLYSRL